ncbi:hypothetical protein BGZ65_002197 [Modicella reniformis]|uniref:Arm-like repeat domain-containing protein n=1 Tax=Modicella reniformis TaxID=1440133 RepID=A0A9P6M9T0_9FUNG|nr:hypothetical protein BGZ65_002197 [Modicella reniformis]
MIFGRIFSSTRGTLSPQQWLELSNIYLENVSKATDNATALVLCYNTKVALSRARKGAKRTKDQAVRNGIAMAYINLGKVLKSQGRLSEEKTCNEKAEKLRSTLNPMVNNPLQLPSQPLHKRLRDIAVVPQLIFENVRPPTIVSKLPEADERLANTPQLACCLSLLRSSHSLDDTLEPIARNWIQAVENDLDEQERLKHLATDMIRIFKNDEHKDAKAISEIVCLSPALEKDAFRGLLIQFYDEINKSQLVDFHQLDGLARLIQGADPDYLETSALEILTSNHLDTSIN